MFFLIWLLRKTHSNDANYHKSLCYDNSARKKISRENVYDLMRNDNKCEAFYYS